MTIAFQNTPVTRNPGFYFEVDPSRANTATRRSRALILAQAIATAPTTTPTSTRARFAQDTATAGTSGTAAALFASMTTVAGATTDGNGTMTTTADPIKYTWIAVTEAAAGSGMHFFDGTGYGGFNGAASTSIYSGADADPTTIHQTYTDTSGTVWNLYRSSGHSVALTFTLSGSGVPTSAPSSSSNLPQTPQIVSSASAAKAAFGQGSPIALMTAQYRARDVFGELWAIPVASNGAGTAGTMVTTFTGPASAAGTLTGYVCGIRVQALITAGMTATQVATAFAAAANLNPDLPVTYAASSAVATATAKVVGPLDLDVRFNYGGQPAGEVFPAGVGATSTVALGTGAPDLTTALANLADEPFDMIMVSYSDTTTLDAIKNFLSDATGRWLSTRLLFGHGFAGMRGTLGAVTTALMARNDQHMTIMPFNDSPTPSWLWAADLVGSIANSLRTDPGLPVQQIAMGVLAPPVQSRFVFSDRDVLLYDGGSTFVVDDDGTVRTSRVITTYQRNTFGIPDDAFLDVETPFQLAEIISLYQGDYSSNYARKKIVSDGTRLGTNNRDTVTPAILSTHALALYRALEAAGKVQDGATFKRLLVTEYVGGGRVNQLLPITLADQLRIIAASVQFTK